MTDGSSRGREPGLARDLGALRRYFWLPAATLVLAVVAALAIGVVHSTSGEARFQENVLIDALPPLFGPPVLPSPFDYARLATSDGVLQQVSQQSGVTVDQLRGRLSATAQFNRPEVDFTVKSGNALALARTWQQAFADAAAEQTPDIQRLLVQPYARQLDEARALLEQRAADAKAAGPDDAVIQQQLKAAQENYEIASKLSQSYDVVARTMKANAVAVVAPHERSAGIGSTAGRLGVAVVIGLLAGVIGALALDYAARRRPTDSELEPFDARRALRGRRRHLS
ncbi:MAG: hypothetical protein M3P30_16685 [Chloroflexota bacterium]|nr:hypothetical protein [Chloroflexota bacterium]